MSTTTVIIGIGLGILLAGVIIWLRNRPRDTFAVVFALGVVALAVAVTIIRVEEYREQKAAHSESSAVPEAPVAPSGSHPGGAPSKPLAAMPPPPLMKGPTGGAAPPAVENPYAGGSR